MITHDAKSTADNAKIIKTFRLLITISILIGTKIALFAIIYYKNYNIFA